MNPYSGASTLATVSSSGLHAGAVDLPLSDAMGVQTLRASAAGLGLVYGSMRLSYLKAGLLGSCTAAVVQA